MMPPNIDTVLDADDALEAIREILSGERWTPETLEAVAEVMAEAGYSIEDVPDALPEG